MINQFTTLTSTAIPLKIENVDTDQIIPARFLKATTREGFGKQLFFDWRYDAQGNPKTDFVLNSPDYTGEILIDLERQTVTLTATGEQELFEISPYKKECLLKGYDDVDYLMSIHHKIEAFEKTR